MRFDAIFRHRTAAPFAVKMLWKLLVSVLSVFTSPFHHDSERTPIQPLTEHERHIAHQAFYSTEEMRVHPEHAGIKDTRFRWPGYPGSGVVPYVIDEDLDDIRETIDEAMEQYHKDTCIRFVPRTNQREYIRIRKQEGCWSYVGKQQEGRAQTVSLAEGCQPLGTVVHELGHAIGLFHEHQRSDRNTYIRVFEGNVLEGYEGQFNRTKPKDEAIYSRYDITSIMHYGNYAFSKDPDNLKTMEAKNGQPLLEPYAKPGLNNRDIQTIKGMYKCKN